MASRGAKPPDEGDFTIDLRTGAETSEPKAVAPTLELETSDLKEMAQSGEARAKAQLLIQTRAGKLLELEPGWSHDTPSPDGGGTPSIVVSEELAPEHAAVVSRTPAIPRATRKQSTPARSGRWLVVFVYIVATTALGLAICERFVL